MVLTPTKQKTEYAFDGRIWVLEVTWKRKKGQPAEAVAVCSGGMFQALLLQQECAKQLKVPTSWTKLHLYRKDKEDEGV